MIGRLIAFVKDWMLLLAMAAGAAVYLIYINIPSLSGFGPALYDAVTALQPVLLFILLFLAFCRISPKDMRPRKWQLWLLLFQAAVFFGLVSLDVNTGETESLFKWLEVATSLEFAQEMGMAVQSAAGDYYTAGISSRNIQKVSPSLVKDRELIRLWGVSDLGILNAALRFNSTNEDYRVG